MESEKISIGKYSLNCYRLNTIIIGSGAASLNAAVSLHSLGKDDIAIATMSWGGGTSRNSGSDKQTYYKLSLSGNEPDSVRAMASDLFDGQCMHGDIALCEAQGSVRAFMNLVSLGVEFPTDKYGSFAGYKTDHDQKGRATSVGPYTSRRMFEVLSSEAIRRGIKVFDKHHCVAILTDKNGSKAIGVLALNTEEKDPSKAFVLFNSVNIILGTGGPGGIYENSVYPLSQEGSAGMAFRAGATGQNLTESQFGIASLKFRWNLSGSYQQAIPRYISTDKNGSDEKEFLNEYFPDIRTLTRAIFLKGYQWPFDPRKINNHGSSLIDILVHREINEKGRKVFLDYSRNPSWSSDPGFSLQNLDQEVEIYLKNSSALKETPYERLLSINTPAVSLYFEHGIDLKNKLLEIAVCAQHNNGGLKGNIWWESDLKHLFPVGEVNGTHGVYRPGGSALNSGQVGSFRAAQFISKNYNGNPLQNSDFVREADKTINSILNLAERWTSHGDGNRNQIYLSQIRKRMSLKGGIIRDKKHIKSAVEEAAELLTVYPEKTGAATVEELSEAFVLYDHCLTHYLYLEAVSIYLDSGGRSRGSYLVIDGDEQADYALVKPKLAEYDKEIENSVLELKYNEGLLVKKLVKTRTIPDQNLWFEKVWKDYIEDNWTEC